MGILFLLSLLLAWPSGGLSILLFIIIYLAAKLLKEKQTHHARRERDAAKNILSGETGYPSWMRDKDELDIFITVVGISLSKRNIPDTFLKSILQNKISADSVFVYAYNLEKEGSSFIEQQVAVTDMLDSLWRSEKQTKNTEEKIAPTVTTGPSRRTSGTLLTSTPFSSAPLKYKDSAKPSNKNSFYNFHYMMEKKKIRITQIVKLSAIKNDRASITFVDQNNYNNNKIAKASLLLKQGDDIQKRYPSLKIEFFSITKDTEHKITTLLLLYKRSTDTLFAHFVNALQRNTNTQTININGDNLNASTLAKAILNDAK